MVGESSHPGAGRPGEPTDPADVDGLVAELKARVEERRRSGAYPAGLSEDLAEHWRRVLRQRAEARPAPDLRGPLHAARQALPLEAARIPTESSLPGGQPLHRAIARVVGRQTQGALDQVQAFAQPVCDALDAIVTVLEELAEAVQVDLAAQIGALTECQRAQEGAIAVAGDANPAAPVPGDTNGAAAP